MANTDSTSIETEIAQHEQALLDLRSKQADLKRAQAGNPKVGDQVIYCREDYVGKVDQYGAMITTMYEDLSADLSVSYINGPISVPHVRFDPSGLPSSWHRSA